MPVAEQLRIHEAGQSTRLGEATGPTRRKVVLIRAGWGSSGYYSESVLARDGANTWPVGTHMYMNHPSASEEVNQPERRVQDLAAVVATTPRMEGIDLVAEAEIKPHWQEVIDSVARDIGVSIRAMGEMEHGEAGGKEGPIITALHEGISADFVTHAGAGGKVGELIESARKTAFDEAADMVEAVQELIKQLKAYGEAWKPQGDSSPGNQEVTEMTDENRLSELEDSVRQLNERASEAEEAKGEAETKATEAEQRAERAEDRLLAQEAERVVSEALDVIEEEAREKGTGLLPERAAKRVSKTALVEKLPTDEDGKLDKDRLTERVKKFAKEEHDYLQGDSNENQDRVTGLPAHEGSPVVTPSGSDEESEGKLAESLGRLGLDEDKAKIAARGR